MNGFSSGSTDESQGGNKRVMQEGRDYYERNIKSSDWFSHGGSGSSNPQPEARLRSDAARDNALKNRGSVGESMGGYANPAPDRAVHPRGVKAEAQPNAHNNKGGNMKNLMENYGNLTVSPKRGPKVKGSEAQEYKEREQGSTKVLLDHYSREPLPESTLEKPPQPRLGLGAGEIAVKHKGEQMGPLMRLEAKKTPRSPRQGPLHQTSKGASQVPPHRVRDDGLQNFEKANNREEMTAIMRGSPTASGVRPRSGKKVMPHLQKSELW